ncbi:hypothetical protein K2173_009390 [Erythroxylum novogranatense]|uniref:Serine-rich protein-like protein n=1 Tax=Erythroxylum novogranatense TaxID=1862640 RepID=A0AAV8U6Y8_9ROSI|nr:hypothetical protein K2173_009390 [Erythroxylum novogranatense]
MASSRNKSNGKHLSTCCHISQRWISAEPSPPSSSGFASSTATGFGSCSSACAAAVSSASTFFARATSPTRVNVYAHHRHNSNPNPSSSSSLRFSIENRPISPNRSIAMRRQPSNHGTNAAVSNQKRTCACSPTTHPGSFRCAFHRALIRNRQGSNGNGHQSYHSSSTLNFRRSAMANSLVRIGGVEGELVKRALTALIRPSSHQLRRRADFQPRPSRLSMMSKAEDL